MTAAVLPPNPGHPFHRASYWLDHRKLIESGGEAVASVRREVVVAELAELLKANNLEVDAEQTLRALEYYAESYTVSTGLPLILSFSIFFDGVVHALAFAGRLEADPPAYDEEKPRVH